MGVEMNGLGLTNVNDKIPEGFFNAYDVEELTLEDIEKYTYLMRKIISEADFLDAKTKLELLEMKTEDYYRKKLEQRDQCKLLIAKDQGKVIGVLEGIIVDDPQARFGFIQWVCVDTDYQSRGVGPSLYQRLEDILKSKNILYMVATINDNNIPSLKMHEQFGFDMYHPFAPRKPGGITQSYFKEIK